MPRNCARTIPGIILLVALALPALAQTQQPLEAPAAPLPAQFLNAKKVFIANGAGDNDPSFAKYTNGPNGPYNQFYANVKALSRYELAASPSEADVVLELRVDYVAYSRGGGYFKLRLEVRDPKANVLLWTFAEWVTDAIGEKAERKYVAEALAKLTDDLKKSVTTQ